MILAIEVSNLSAVEPVQGASDDPRPGLALGSADDGPRRVVGTRAITGAQPLEVELLRGIEELYRSCGVVPAQTSLIAVSCGPGGYTSLRIACSVAMAIAESTGARCCAVPTALAVARRAKRFPCCVVLSSKDDTAYAAIFDASGRVIDQGLRNAATLAWDRFDLLLGDRFLPGDLRAKAEQRGVEVALPVFDPVSVLELAGDLPGEVAGGVKVCAPEALAPIYPREPEAVTKWALRRTDNP
ncbi:MAG: hypothetical protein SFZ23_06885 [Planctomycetota bacterium]|nr:hypothetical protein [Planctomycetota bacterium]